MKLARVTGTVVCDSKLESFQGEKLLLIQPLDSDLKPDGRELVATDMTSSGPGELVLFETGREAAIALENTWNVSDATVTAIVDSVDEDGGIVKRIAGGTKKKKSGDSGVLLVERSIKES